MIGRWLSGIGSEPAPVAVQISANQGSTAQVDAVHISVTQVRCAEDGGNQAGFTQICRPQSPYCEKFSLHSRQQRFVARSIAKLGNDLGLPYVKHQQAILDFEVAAAPAGGTEQSVEGLRQVPQNL
jgi:hypothetical protein